MKITATLLVTDAVKAVYPTASEIRFGTDIITIYCDDNVKLLSYRGFHQMIIDNATILK